MSLGKILALTAAILFGIIFVAVLFKKEPSTLRATSAQAMVPITPTSIHQPIEIQLEEISKPVAPAKAAVRVESPKEKEIETKVLPEEKPVAIAYELQEVDRVQELFNITGPKLPIVETITYKSRVSWLKGRPAWLSDYATHYSTSRHFIARSLNGKPDYLKQDLAEGNKFNVYRSDIPFEFHLVIDVSLCKLFLYCVQNKEKTLLRSYPVSLGRTDSSATSGLLTPLGKYSLGNRTAIYKPGVMGHHKGQKVEMVTVFGTRWIPFEKEISSTTAPAKGLGLHGVPWQKNSKGEWEENLSSLGKYESDGCVRMCSKDIEEIFAIVVPKTTYVILVKKVADVGEL